LCHYLIAFYGLDATGTRNELIDRLKKGYSHHSLSQQKQFCSDFKNTPVFVQDIVKEISELLGGHNFLIECEPTLSVSEKLRSLIEFLDWPLGKLLERRRLNRNLYTQLKLDQVIYDKFPELQGKTILFDDGQVCNLRSIFSFSDVVADFSLSQKAFRSSTLSRQKCNMGILRPFHPSTT
jgi:hypothetical protein